MGPFKVNIYLTHIVGLQMTQWGKKNKRESVGGRERDLERERERSPEMLIFFSFKVTLRHQLRPLKVFLYRVTA